jgi:hypothetical protein
MRTSLGRREEEYGNEGRSFLSICKPSSVVLFLRGTAAVAGPVSYQV